MRGTRRTVTGLGLVIAGALLGMLALTALPWFRGTLGGVLIGGSDPSGLRSTLTYYSDRETDPITFVDVGLARPFFGWLGIVVLAAAVLTAVFAAGSDARSGAARVGGPVAAVVGAAGVALTFVAVDLVTFDPYKAPAKGIRPDTPAYGDYVGATGIGAWAMVLAFLLVGAGGLVAAGSRERLRELLSDQDPGDDDEDVDEKAAPDPSPVSVRKPSAEPRRDRADENW